MEFEEYKVNHLQEKYKTSQHKIEELVREHKIERAQQLYFESEMDKRKNLIKL